MNVEDLAAEQTVVVNKTTDKWRLQKILIERDRVFIEWTKGRMVDGEYVADMRDTLELKDVPAVLDEEGEEIAPADPAFTNFLKAAKVAGFVDFIRMQLQAKELV